MHSSKKGSKMKKTVGQMKNGLPGHDKDTVTSVQTVGFTNKDEPGRTRVTEGAHCASFNTNAVCFIYSQKVAGSDMGQHVILINLPGTCSDTRSHADFSGTGEQLILTPVCLLQP